MSTTATSPKARKLSVDQMLRLMQLEMDKAQAHNYSLSGILVQLDGFDDADEKDRLAAMPEVFRVLKHVTFERKVQGLGFWTEKLVLAVFPHVSPTEIAELGKALVEKGRAIALKGALADRDVTISAGVAHNQHSGPMSFEILIREAETGLSMAQRGGGDRCIQWLDVESELDRLRDDLDEQMAEVDRQYQVFAQQQDALAEKRSRELVDSIKDIFGREQATEATVRIEKEMIALAISAVDGWRDSSLAQELTASQRQIDNLERRVRKLTDILDVTESELRRVAAMKQIDTGLSSIYRTVQGLSFDDPNAGMKKELMKSIFEANLALQGADDSESPQE